MLLAMQMPAELPLEPDTPVTEDAAPTGEHHQVYCPTCSSRLESRRCKLICHQCGYYMSCADYY